MDKVINACKDMEPIDGLMLTEIEARGIELTSLQSIAISLKRIADSMEKASKLPVMNTEGISQEDWDKLVFKPNNFIVNKP